MSNFSFLIKNKEWVEQYPWLSVVYKDALVTEYAFFEENKRRMFREARNVLESVVKCYCKERKITVKKKKRSYKKGELQITGKKKVDFDSLYDQINTIKPIGELMLQAHAVRIYGNKAVHEFDYTGDGREFDCLKNLHDVVLWFYNDLTGENVEQEFRIDKIEKMALVSEKDRFSTAVALLDNKTEKKPKKKRKQIDAISITQNNGQIILTDGQGNELFAFTPTKEENSVVVSKVSNLEQKMREIAKFQKNVNIQIQTCISENQSAYAQIQNYIGKLNLQQENAQAMLEWFSKVQKEQYELLTSKMVEIESQISDKENVIQLLQQLLLERDDKITYLTARIENLIDDVDVLHATLKNADVKKEYQWLGQWYLETKDQFENRNFTGNTQSQSSYTTDQVRQLFEAFKLRYNQVRFLYESEKIIGHNKDAQIAEYKHQIEMLRRESLEKDCSLEEKANLNEKNKKRYKRSLKLVQFVALILVVLLVASLINTEIHKNNALAYKEQYDVLLDKLSFYVSSEEDDKQETESEEMESEVTEDETIESETQIEETESESNKNGTIKDQIYTSPDGSYQIRVPYGWDIYSSGNTVYLGTNAEVLESDMFYLNTDPVFSYEEKTMNAVTEFWSEEFITFLKYDYSEYGGRPAVKEYSFVTFELNGKKGGNVLLSYSFAGENVYEFKFVDRNSNGDLEPIAEQMMNSIVFLDGEVVKEDTESVLKRLASDMLEAYFVRLNLSDTMIHLSEDYIRELGDSLSEMLNSQPSGDFYYEVDIISYTADAAEAKIHMGRENISENTSTMRFIKEGNAWKIDYFDK